MFLFHHVMKTRDELADPAEFEIKKLDSELTRHERQGRVELHQAGFGRFISEIDYMSKK